jgi:septal ring factor EnvC (AmiA/AmiB activator)
LKRNNEILLSDSTQSQRDLIRALSLLKESQAELQRLQDLLKALKAESLQAKADLSTANSELKQVSESFKQYEREKKREIRKYQIISVVLLLTTGALAFK